jgi:hypothetical protein
MLKTDAEVLCHHFYKTFHPSFPYWCLGVVGMQRKKDNKGVFCNDDYYVKTGVLIIFAEKGPTNGISGWYEIMMGANYHKLNFADPEWSIVFTLTSR